MATQPLTLPDAATIDENLQGEGRVDWLVTVQQEGIAAQGGHLGGEDDGALQEESPMSDWSWYYLVLLLSGAAAKGGG